MGRMTAAVASDVEQVGVVHVRDRADVRRQVKLVVVFAIVALLLLWFALDINDSTVSYTLGDTVSADNPPKDLNGLAVIWGCFAVALLALGATAVNRVPRGCSISNWPVRTCPPSVVSGCMPNCPTTQARWP